MSDSFCCTVEANTWQPTPVFLPGESQGQSLVGCHLWGRTESNTTEVTYQQQQQKRLSMHALRWPGSSLKATS